MTKGIGKIFSGTLKISIQNLLESYEKKFPCLTTKDLKYCCYLKMNMSNQDIRHILGINQDSVRMHKYRLKKKMTLSKKVDLRSYINSFANER